MRDNPFGWRTSIVSLSAALALAAVLLVVLNGGWNTDGLHMSLFLGGGIFLQSIALARLVREPDGDAPWFAVLAALVGGLGVLGYMLAYNGVLESAARAGFALITFTDVHMGGALALFVCASATATAATRRRHGFGAEALAAGGLIGWLLVPAILVGQALHLVPLEAGTLAQRLLPAEAAMLLAVAAMLLLVAARLARDGFDFHNRFLPALAFGVLLTASFHLWLVLLGEEQLSIRRQTTATATRIQAGLVEHLDERKDALERMTQRLVTAGEERNRDEWARDAAAYLDDFGSISAIGWITADGIVRWAISRDDDRHLEGQRYAVEATRAEVLELARRRGTIGSSDPVRLRAGGYGQIVALPLQERSTFIGWLVVGLRFEELFASEVGAAAANFGVRIWHRDTVIFERAGVERAHPLSRPARVEVVADNLVWHLEVWPAHAFFENLFLWLPGCLLTLGLLAALLFAITLYQLEAQRRQTASLRASEERYRLVAEQTGAVVYDYDLASGEIDWAGAIEDVTGDRRESFAHVDIGGWEKRVHPDDLELVADAFERAETGLEKFHCEYRFARNDGHYVRVEDRGVFLPGPDGAARRMLGNIADVSQRHEYEQQLRYLAHFDQQTGLRNRVWFMEEVVQRTEGRRANASVWVAFLDVDRFRAVNETLGHVVGDLLLEAVARRLEAVVSGRGELARIGGDEFGLCVHGSGVNETTMTALGDELMRAFAVPFSVGGHSLFVTLSVGIAGFPRDGDDAQQVIRAAETAMFRAKHRGRNTWALFESSMSAGARENLEIAMALRLALERDEFHLVFQPRYGLLTGRITGMEALLRWNSAELGIVPPAQFIPVAEETGLIGPIGWYVVGAAAEAARKLGPERMRGRRIAINVSARQLIHAGFVAELVRRIEAAGASPRWFELELTESLVMEDPGRARELFVQLHEAGFSISIDDFGTGYSSLSYLKHFPVDHLKIDRSFIMELPGNTDDAAIVRTIISMGRGLGLNLIAEGIETEAQSAFLAAAGCQEAQGFLFSRPLPLHGLIALLD